ncbi:hypothetical protein [Sphingomicrobium nitratireducens]|uniref:hypothetical protein n=1 Tax=Sphingomicrobium nitratireducens TaxID=2964666 RepID=UPI00224024E5|nr:hypothetical protein [Sphingomicrobium nitratireducens]
MVFAACGSVWITIAIAEEYLRHLLMDHLVNSLKTGPKSADHPAVAKALSWQRQATFGALKQQVCDKLKLSADTLVILTDAKNMRDNLVHEFWYPRFPMLQTKEGAALVRQELELMDNHFVGVMEHLFAETGQTTKTLADFINEEADDPLRHEGFKVLIEKFRATQEQHGIGKYRKP